MIGAFATLAASRAATTVEEEVTFYNYQSTVNAQGQTMAGIANWFFRAYSKSYFLSNRTEGKFLHEEHRHR